MSDFIMTDDVCSRNLTFNEALSAFGSFTDANPRITNGFSILGEKLVRLVVKKWNQRPINQRAKGFYLDTNNVSLAKICKCRTTKGNGQRTIYNRTRVLMECGLIIKKQRTGRGLRLWLTPQLFICSDRKKLPPLVLEPFDVKNKIAPVDNSEAGAARTWSGNDKNVFKNIEGHHDSRAALSGGGGPGMGSLNEYVGKFWTSAKDRLYPGVKFPESREKVLIDLIASRFHMRQAESDKSPFDIYYKQMTYLDSASTWFKSHPEVTPPDPYHYFSSGLSGFRFDKIEEWEKRNEVSVNMRKSRIKIQVEAAQTKRLGFEDKVSIIGVHSNAIRAMHSPRLDKWFVQEYPKFLQP